LPPEVVGPRGRYLTGLVEPYGALPRKCLFIVYLMVFHYVSEKVHTYVFHLIDGMISLMASLARFHLPNYAAPLRNNSH
jgi:hypothetical protein